MSPKLVYYIIRLLEGMGMGSFFPIYSPWLELHGLNFLKMGIVNFFYHISSSVLDPFTGFFADKFGKRKSFIFGQILWTSTQFIYGASTQISGFLLAEGVAAIGNSMKSDALESWLQNRVGKAEAGKIMGKAGILFTTGQIATSILAGYISVAFGMNIAWYVSGAFFLSATVVGGIALFAAGEDRACEIHKTNESADLAFGKIVELALTNKKIVTAVIITSAINFVCKPIFMYWPQIVAELGMQDTQRGFTILAISLPTMVSGILAGQNRLLTQDKVGLGRVLALLGIGLIIASLARNINVFFVGLMVLELGYGATSIIIYGYLYNEIHSMHRSTINSIVSSARTFGGALSLLFMGTLADLYTPQHTLLIGGVLLLLVRWIFRKAKE